MRRGEKKEIERHRTRRWIVKGRNMPRSLQNYPKCDLAGRLSPRPPRPAVHGGFHGARRVLHKSPADAREGRRERVFWNYIARPERRGETSPPADFQSSSQRARYRRRGIWTADRAESSSARCASSPLAIDASIAEMADLSARSAILCLSTNRPPERQRRSLVDRKRKSIARPDGFIGKKKEF